MLFDFLKTKNVCMHNNVPIDVDEAYCPDCGALVKNKWFLVRCSCCNIKRKAHTEYNNVVPDTHYCPNCGSTDFYLQELDEINFMDVHYAIFKKVVVSQERNVTRQIWVEENEDSSGETKLLGLKR